VLSLRTHRKLNSRTSSSIPTEDAGQQGPSRGWLRRCVCDGLAR